MQAHLLPWPCLEVQDGHLGAAGGGLAHPGGEAHEGDPAEVPERVPRRERPHRAAVAVWIPAWYEVFCTLLCSFKKYESVLLSIHSLRIVSGIVLYTLYT